MNGTSITRLRDRVLKAGAWTAAGYFVSQFIRFGSNLLMTHLLVPEAFGVMSIATMVMYGLSLLSDVGVGPNIVYSKRGAEALFLNTAWAIQIRRGFVLWFCALAVSLLIVAANHFGIVPARSVYATRQLPYVIAILSLGAIIGGFESTKLFEASRNLAIDRITQIEFVSQIVGLVSMVTWVAIDRSIWALVAGSMLASLTRVVLSHTYLPGAANRWQWDPAAFREIIHFGKWVFLSSILGFFVNSGDRILLSGMLSANTLGVYSVAYLVVSSIEGILNRVISEVFYPALSEVVREKPKELTAIYYRIYVIIASGTYVVAGILITTGPLLTRLLYDNRYAQAGWMLPILATGLIAIPSRVSLLCFQALGNPRLLSAVIAIRVAALYLITPIAFHRYGLPGALWSIVLSGFAGLPLTYIYASRYKLFSWRRELLLLPCIVVGMIFGKTCTRYLPFLFDRITSHLH